MSTTIRRDDDVDELRAVANRLYRRRPCRQRVNCLAAERERSLLPMERHCFGWSVRPYEGYDLTRMCDACVAFWHAEMSARTVERLALAEEGERPRLPQKG